MAALGIRGSWNQYAYTRDDPINRYDPQGLQDEGFETQVWCPALSTYTSQPNCDLAGGPPKGPEEGLTYCPDGTVVRNGLCPNEVANRPLGFAGANDALAKSDCYKLFGFSSAMAAERFFKGINFETGSFGQLQVQSVPGGLQIVNGTPPPAESIAQTSTIKVNYSYNWANLASVTATNITTGGSVVIDYLAIINGAIGTNMSAGNLSNLILLHELKHVRGAPQESQDEFNKFNREIYDKCIK